jgi:predicted kinase
MPPSLVIVSGPPASGKTAVAKRIAESFDLPLIHKDAIKETLFDLLGWKDRDWSRKLGAAAFELLFYFTDVQLAAGRSAVIEGNFRRLASKHEFVPIQIMCWADGETLAHRFRERNESGDRHPGHVDRVAIEDVETELRSGRYEPLNLGGEVIEVETTDFGAIDFEWLLRRVGSLLGTFEPSRARS